MIYTSTYDYIPSIYDIAIPANANANANVNAILSSCVHRSAVQ